MPYDTEEVIRGVAKSKNVPFTKYEAVAFLNSYLQYVNGEMTRSEAIADCSGKLRQMAVSSGQRLMIHIDLEVALLPK